MAPWLPGTRDWGAGRTEPGEGLAPGGAGPVRPRGLPGEEAASGFGGPQRGRAGSGGNLLTGHWELPVWASWAGTGPWAATSRRVLPL